MILGVDVSGWNTSINWDSLYSGGIRFAIVKLTQGTSSVTNLAENHITNARRVGMVVAGYHWADPMMNDKAQIDFFASHMDRHNIKLGYVDVEQYWADWKEFYDGKITKFIDKTRISQCAYNIMTGIRNLGLKSQTYSRWSFITDRADPMKLWIPPEESWYAHYPYKIGKINANWQDFLPGGAWYPTLPAPYLPSNVKWRMWQFSGDKFILPGTGGSPIDLNFFSGTEKELINFFAGNVIIPTPPPVTPPTTGAILPKLKVIKNVFVRTTPSTAIKEIAERKPGDTVNVLEIKPINTVSVWVRDEIGWSAVVHYGVRYME